MTEFRIGQGYDVHRIADGLPMYLCGVQIPSERGFVAHSDGDVAIHALCDALLGALALGDIGHLFPDSDPAYKGISSILLLRTTLADALGVEVGSVSVKATTTERLGFVGRSEGCEVWAVVLLLCKSASALPPRMEPAK